MVGRIVGGKYRIISQIGLGDRGIVYRAERREGDPVAVKVLHRHLVTNTELRGRFLREARAEMNLDHPNICKVLDCAETDGIPFLVMELYEGETLARRLAQGPIPMVFAMDIAHQIASGLDYAHGEKIVHRDIKPDNVLLDRHGRIRILDFGLAQVSDGEDLTLYGGGRQLGSPSYMSPEQIEGAVDLRTDLWSLGVTLYEMLTGMLPFRGKDPHHIMLAIAAQEPLPLEECGIEAPKVVQRILDRALTKSLLKRYSSAEEMADDLTYARYSGFRGG